MQCRAINFFFFLTLSISLYLSLSLYIYIYIYIPHSKLSSSSSSHIPLYHSFPPLYILFRIIVMCLILKWFQRIIEHNSSARVDCSYHVAGLILLELRLHFHMTKHVGGTKLKVITKTNICYLHM